jgi:hypothetical protein
VSIPRDTFVGLRRGPPVESEAEHFYRCQVCGQIVDMRDLGEVFDHEGDPPHPVEDRAEQGRREELVATAV